MKVSYIKKMKFSLLGCLFPVFLLVAVGQFAADDQKAGRKVSSAGDGDSSTVVRNQNAQKLEGLVIDLDKENTIARQEEVLPREGVEPEDTYQKQVTVEVNDVMPGTGVKEGDGKIDIEWDDHSGPMKVGRENLVEYGTPDPVESKEERGGDENEDVLAGEDNAIQGHVDDMEYVYDTVERYEEVSPRESVGPEGIHQKQVPVEVVDMSKISGEEREGDDDDNRIKIEHKDLIDNYYNLDPVEDKEEQIGNVKEELLVGVERETPRNPNEEKNNKHKSQKYKERNDEPVQRKIENVLASAESETPRHTNEEISKEDTHLEKKENDTKSDTEENADVIARDDSDTLENTNVGEGEDVEATIARPENIFYGESIESNNVEQKKVSGTEEPVPETRGNDDNDRKVVREGDVGHKELSDKHYQTESVEKVADEYAHYGHNEDGYSSAAEDSDTNKGYKKDENPGVPEGAEENNRSKMVESSPATKDAHTNYGHGKEDYSKTIEDTETKDGQEKDDNSVLTEDAETNNSKEKYDNSVLSEDAETKNSQETDDNSVLTEDAKTKKIQENDDKSVLTEESETKNSKEKDDNSVLSEDVETKDGHDKDDNYVLTEDAETKNSQEKDDNSELTEDAETNNSKEKDDNSVLAEDAETNNSKEKYDNSVLTEDAETKNSQETDDNSVLTEDAETKKIQENDDKSVLTEESETKNSKKKDDNSVLSEDVETKDGHDKDDNYVLTEDAETKNSQEKDDNSILAEDVETKNGHEKDDNSILAEDAETKNSQEKDDNSELTEDVETNYGQEKDNKFVITDDADTRDGRENVEHSVGTQDEETNAGYEKEVSRPTSADEDTDASDGLETDTETDSRVSQGHTKDTNLVGLSLDRSGESRVKISNLDDTRLPRETDSGVYKYVSEVGNESNTIRDEEISAANGDDNEIDFKQEDVSKYTFGVSEKTGDFCWSSIEDDEWATVEDDNEEVADNRSCKKESLIDFWEWEPRSLVDIAEEVESNRLPRHQHTNHHLAHCPPCWAWVYGWQMPSHCQICSPDWAMLNSWCQWCRWDMSNWICRWLLWCF